ncbi:HORMA domain-containing protein 1-like protein [Leptotrombidium deliense]|uniref:HORMA domain-containing protein 1-like protein n=1 Tax=Leptotrombidium deliense TaxID=299467 RepID=A0A443SF72_9ACAR|nr:HORMA domain-containing protein 1-like protein [Leptotrombidium deliense]
MLTVVHSLNPLPEECYFTVKLYYYDDVTPEDYHPPGFQASKSNTTTVRGKPMAVNSGAVSTKYHSLKIKMKVDGFKEASNESGETLCKSREIIEVNDLEKVNSDVENVKKSAGTNGETSKKRSKGMNGSTSKKSDATNGQTSKKSDEINSERPKKKKKLIPDLKK